MLMFVMPNRPLNGFRAYNFLYVNIDNVQNKIIRNKKKSASFRSPARALRPEIIRKSL